MLFGKRERSICKILLVEDEPLVAFDNEYLLSDAGYHVVATVDSFEAAAKVIEEQQLDLILTDIKLNGEGDGMDVAKAAAEKQIPVLFVSGHCPVLSRNLAIGCLAKPYTDKVLKNALDTLDQVLQGREVKKLPSGLSLYRDP